MGVVNYNAGRLAFVSLPLRAAQPREHQSFRDAISNGAVFVTDISVVEAIKQPVVNLSRNTLYLLMHIVCSRTHFLISLSLPRAKHRSHSLSLRPNFEEYLYTRKAVVA